MMDRMDKICMFIIPVVLFTSFWFSSNSSGKSHIVPMKFRKGTIPPQNTPYEIKLKTELAEINSIIKTTTPDYLQLLTKEPNKEGANQEETGDNTPVTSDKDLQSHVSDSSATSPSSIDNANEERKSDTIITDTINQESKSAVQELPTSTSTADIDESNPEKKPAPTTSEQTTQNTNPADQNAPASTGTATSNNLQDEPKTEETTPEQNHATGRTEPRKTHLWDGLDNKDTLVALAPVAAMSVGAMLASASRKEEPSKSMSPATSGIEGQPKETANIVPPVVATEVAPKPQPAIVQSKDPSPSSSATSSALQGTSHSVSGGGEAQQPAKVEPGPKPPQQSVRAQPQPTQVQSQNPRPSSPGTSSDTPVTSRSARVGGDSHQPVEDEPRLKEPKKEAITSTVGSTPRLQTLTMPTESQSVAVTVPQSDDLGPITMTRKTGPNGMSTATIQQDVKPAPTEPSVHEMPITRHYQGKTTGSPISGQISSPTITSEPHKKQPPFSDRSERSPLPGRNPIPAPLKSDPHVPVGDRSERSPLPGRNPLPAPLKSDPHVPVGDAKTSGSPRSGQIPSPTIVSEPPKKQPSFSDRSGPGPVSGRGDRPGSGRSDPHVPADDQVQRPRLPSGVGDNTPSSSRSIGTSASPEAEGTREHPPTTERRLQHSQSKPISVGKADNSEVPESARLLAEKLRTQSINGETRSNGGGGASIPSSSGRGMASLLDQGTSDGRVVTRTSALQSQAPKSVAVSIGGPDSSGPTSHPVTFHSSALQSQAPKSVAVSIGGPDSSGPTPHPVTFHSSKLVTEPPKSTSIQIGSVDMPVTIHRAEPQPAQEEDTPAKRAAEAAAARLRAQRREQTSPITSDDRDELSRHAQLHGSRSFQERAGLVSPTPTVASSPKFSDKSEIPIPMHGSPAAAVDQGNDNFAEESVASLRQKADAAALARGVSDKYGGSSGYRGSPAPAVDQGNDNFAEESVASLKQKAAAAALAREVSAKNGGSSGDRRAGMLPTTPAVASKVKPSAESEIPISIQSPSAPAVDRSNSNNGEQSLAAVRQRAAAAATARAVSNKDGGSASAKPNIAAPRGRAQWRTRDRSNTSPVTNNRRVVRTRSDRKEGAPS